MDYQLGPGPLQVDQNTTDEKIKGDIGIVENGDIATHAILKDYYVIWKGDLYKAKSDISSGTTLSAGSNGNLDPKSNGLGGEVAALNSKFTYGVIRGGTIMAGTDVNNVVETGVYRIVGGTAHSPDGSQGWQMLVMGGYSGLIVQIAISSNGSITSRGSSDNGVNWSAWK